MDKCDEEHLNNNIEHLRSVADRRNTTGRKTISHSASTSPMDSLGLNIKSFNISRPWLNKNWRIQKQNAKPPEEMIGHNLTENSSTFSIVPTANMQRKNSTTFKSTKSSSCSSGSKRRTIYGGTTFASTFSVFLIKCLIVATAYDDKFVNKLLANRTVVDNGISLGGHPDQNNHGTVDSMGRHNPGHNNPSSNPDGNPHNNSNSGPVTLYDLKHGTESAPGVAEHSVRCLLNVENWTAWRLKDALVHNNCGYIMEKYGAKNIEPATREVMVGYKQGGTATGTCGTISWQIEHLDTRLIVMWSVPFNLNIHDSYFAIGMIFNRGRFTSSSYWFNQMYYSEKGPYKRGSGGQTITFENSAVVVVGHMEPSTYHPMLNISVIPQVPYKLAPLIWRRLYDNDRARYTGRGSASPVKTGGGTAGRFSLTGKRLQTAPGRWWTTECLSYIFDGGILTSILIAVVVAAYANILARCHSTSPIKASLPNSSSTCESNKPTISASSASTTKHKNTNKCSLEKDSSSQTCDIECYVTSIRASKTHTSCNNNEMCSNDGSYIKTKTIANSTSEPIPQATVFKPKMDILPISIDAEKNEGKSISTSKLIKDEDVQ